MQLLLHSRHEVCVRRLFKVAGTDQAVKELYKQKVKILTEDEEPEIETDFEVKDRTPEEIKKEEEYAEE